MKLEKFCGGKIYLDVTESPTMQGFKLCSWQYKQRQILGDLASHIDTFVDIGACLGYFTLFMAKKMNDKGRILSFEPHPEDYKWLNKSIKANGYNSIETFQTALSNKEGTTNLYLANERGQHSLIGKYKKIRVKTTKLDTILKDKVDLVKIDVEGGELIVLEGMEETIENNPNLIITIDMHPEKIDVRKTIQFLYNQGFNIYSICHNLQPISQILDPNTIGEILAKKG